MIAALDQLAGWIAASRRLVVMTGAGMSTESGIPDFRSYQGRYTRDQSLPEVISIDYFYRDPVAFWAAFKDIFQLKLSAGHAPNDGHRLLAALDDGDRHVTVVTQNVDGLHARAGSRHIVEVHGSIERAQCPSCGTVHDLDWINAHTLPECSRCGDILKPDVVLYGEAVERMDDAVAALTDCDLLLVMGSSLEVGPINQLPLIARRIGLRTVLVNLGPTQFESAFDLRITDRIGLVARELAPKLGLTL